MSDETEYIYPSGFEKAIVGIDLYQGRWIMDKHTMCEILMEEDGMTEEDAIDFLSYNVWGCSVGEHTPIYMDSGNFDELTHLLGL